CERLIFRHHFCDTGIHHLRHWQPILVIYKPVQKRTKLRLDRSILRTDHRSAHYFWLKSYLIDGAKETGRIVQIRAKKQYVRIDLFQTADERGKVSRRERISGVRYNLET